MTRFYAVNHSGLAALIETEDHQPVEDFGQACRQASDRVKDGTPIWQHGAYICQVVAFVQEDGEIKPCEK